MDGPGASFESKTVDAVTSGVDLVPTLLETLGLPVPERLDGVSFDPYLCGETATPPREMAFAKYTEDAKRDNESRTVITQDEQLIRYFDQGRTIEYPVAVDPKTFAKHEARLPTGAPRPFAQLFDLEADPYELDDRADEPGEAESVRGLSKALLRWMVTVDDPLLDGRVRIPYYERAMDDLYTTSLAD
jgi:arylsulfatase A-like enzyme